MTQLTSGVPAPNLVLPAIDGSVFDLSKVKGKRVILTFFRFSSCPLCNMRIRRIVQRWGEFSEDTVMVGVFDASVKDLTKRMKKHNPPFTIVADETYEHFLNNGVQKSFGKFILGAAKSPLTLLQATLRGYVPLTLSVSKLSTIPADILIDESGTVVKAHYCKDTAGHLSIDDLVAFSHGN
ncbi:MAG: redoxin domain-containing protein [Candidatus Poseidoniales archaeon]|jgi:peroxiredoxin Q/BCP